MFECKAKLILKDLDNSNNISVLHVGVMGGNFFGGSNTALTNTIYQLTNGIRPWGAITAGSNFFQVARPGNVGGFLVDIYVELTRGDFTDITVS